MSVLQKLGINKNMSMKPLFNVGALLDIPTGSIVTGKYGESIINGGLSTIEGFVGPGNNFKSTIMHYMMYTAADRAAASFPDVEMITYDTEDNMLLNVDRYNNFINNHTKYLNKDPINIGQWVIIPKSQMSADVWVKEVLYPYTTEKEKDNKNSSTYSTNSLNQIKIQSTSTAVSDFSKNLKEIDKNLEKENNSNLIGFNVVDKDNKKLSFRSFCSVISINLPESIISNIDDDFVVYAYRSPVTLVTRFSIVAKSLNSVMLKKSLNSYEANLVNSMYPLFIEKISKRSDVVFEDSEYDSNRIRFFNFKDGTNKSIDYSVVGDKLFIATSMETMHFLMDTLLFKK